MPTKANHDRPDTSAFSMLANLVRQGTESFFATQRILLDLVVRQNTHTFNAIRERFAEARSAPGAILTEMAGEGISNFIAAQRVLLNLAQRENEILMTGIKERSIAPPMEAVADIMRRGVETLIDMHQHFLTTAAKQTDLWIDAAKEGKPYAGKGVNEMVREAMETFVRSQKKFLDVVAEETSNATEGRHDGRHPRKTELTELAKQATEALMDAQKKLLDVATQQVAVNVKVGRETLQKLNPFPAFEFADITRNTVDSFVTAQKALLDVMAKPNRGPRAAEHPMPKAKRPGPKRHKATPVPVPA